MQYLLRSFQKCKLCRLWALSERRRSELDGRTGPLFHFKSSDEIIDHFGIAPWAEICDGFSVLQSKSVRICHDYLEFKHVQETAWRMYGRCRLLRRGMILRRLQNFVLLRPCFHLYQEIRPVIWEDKLQMLQGMCARKKVVNNVPSHAFHESFHS